MLQSELWIFMQQYTRRRHAGRDPNDRMYDRGIERKLKQVSPEELDRMLNGDDEDYRDDRRKQQS